MNGLLDLLKKFSPLNEEEQVPERSPAVGSNMEQVAPPAASPTSPVPTQQYIPNYEEFDVKEAVQPLMQTRDANYQAPQVNFDDLLANNNQGQEVNFKTDLEALKEQYEATRQDAAQRRMYGDMLAAVGNNIGNIVGGATAMNTKAAVSPTKTAPINVRDSVAEVEKRFGKDYDALMQQYKGLKDGQLRPRDILEARKVNAFLKQGEARINNQTDNVNKSNIGRAASMINKAVEQDEITAKQESTISDIDKTIDSIDKLEGMSKDFLTGPVRGRVEKIKSYLGANEGARAALSAQLGGILSSYAKSISGTAVADQEYARLENQLPKETDNPEVFADKMARFKEEMENSRLRVIDSIAKSGRNVKNFVKRESIDDLKKKYNGETSASAPNGQDVVESNGKTYKWNPSVGKYQLWLNKHVK